MVLRHSSILACVALLTAGAVQPLFGAEHWISVSTAHFEMYTPDGEKQAERSLQGFEQVRYFFLQNSKNKQLTEDRVRVIAFSSEKEFKAFRPNAGTFAFYQQSHDRDYIAMQDINPEHHAAAVHEYTHLIIRHLDLKVPLWLEEGMAEVYSSLEPRGAQAMIGRPPESDWLTASSRPFMDWNLLVHVDHDSPYYNQPDKMPVFYAQSWALTHMLLLGKSYRAKFDEFLAAISTGAPTADVLQKVYGKSVEEVGKDVQRYVHQTTVQAALFDVKLAKSDLDFQVSELSPFQKELAFVGLLSGRPQMAPEAQRRLLALEQQNPDSVELQESLGYLAWQLGNTPDAVKHFALAMNQGSRNARMLTQYAGLLRNANASSDEIEKALQKAVAIQPENVDALLFLADTELQKQRYARVLITLTPVHSVKPEQAYNFFAMSAWAKANLKDYTGGKDYAQKALRYADSPSQRANMTRLLEFIDGSVNRKDLSANAVGVAVLETPLSRQAPAPESNVTENRPTLRRTEGLPRVQGKTKSFECGKGTYRLHVQTADREMVFAIVDLGRVVVRNKESGVVEWNCGPLKPLDITVVYKPSEGGTAAGNVAELIF